VSYSVPAISPGGSHVVVASVTAAAVGNARYLRAYVDAACTIPELTEANNQASWFYASVATPGTDLAVMDVSGALLPRWTSKLYARPKKAFGLKVAIYNRGTVAAPVGTVMAYLHDDGQDPPDCAKTPKLCPRTTSQALVQPGVSNAVEVTIVGLKAPAALGTHHIVVIADAGAGGWVPGRLHRLPSGQGRSLARMHSSATVLLSIRSAPQPASLPPHPSLARRPAPLAADNQTPEVVESNDYPRTFTVVPKARPEFNVTLAAALPSPVTAGTLATLTARITNVGLKPGAPGLVAVRGSGDDLFQNLVANSATPKCNVPASATWAQAPALLTAKLAVGASVMVDIPNVALGEAAQGKHYAVIVVDAACATREASELLDPSTQHMNWAATAYYIA
jgi:hypothetical protein